MDAKELFDSLAHVGIYIVERETMRTLYENPTAQKYSVKNRIGKPCYSIHGNLSMCHSCPLRSATHTSLVNRTDLGMIFIVRGDEIKWEGRPAYLISVAKQSDLLLHSENEKSMNRMTRALQKSVNIYTEINMETLRYRKINLQKAQFPRVPSHGDYAAAFAQMCQNEIDPADAAAVRSTMAPEVLQQQCADSSGPDEVAVRYRLKNATPPRTMESRAIFVRDELPHYVVNVTRDITGETQLEAQAHTMERILSNVSCGVVIYKLSADGALTISYMNDGLSEMVECTPAQLWQAALRDPLVTVDAAHRDAMHKALITAAQGTKTTVTYHAVTFAGHPLWVTVKLSGVRRPSGSTRIYGTFFDVTAEYEAQQEFQKKYRLERRRSQDDSSILAYAVFDLRTHATLEMERRPPLVSLGQSLSLEAFCADIAKTIVSAEKRARFVQMFDAEALLRAHKNGADECSLVFPRALPNGKVIWVKSSFHLIADSGGTDILLFYYCNDVNLSKSLELMTASMADEDYDMLGCINFADDSAILLYGAGSSIPPDSGSGVCRQESYSHALEQFVEKAVVPEERAHYRTNAFVGRIRAMLAERGSFEFTLHVTDQNGAIRTKKIRYSRYDSDLEICFFSQTDITEMLAAEQAKQEALRKALLAAKQANEAKTAFLSRMSHDMRTPMNGILGLAELSEEESDAEVLRCSIRRIKESGDYLLSLINDTLDFQRIESGKLTLEPQIVPTETVLDGILDIVRPAAEKKKLHFTVRNDNADLNWYIRLDPVRFKQIFINLLSNAIKFTPEGGTVMFSFGCLGRDGLISHDYITVSDSGIGMSEDFVKNRLFKPFSQESSAVSAQYAGSGLGLSIVKSLVTLMGGHIDVESTPEHGTTFTVYLDFERVEAAEAKAQLHESRRQSSDAAQHLAGRRLLLVEDHPLNAEIAKKLLQRVGCTVDWAQDGQRGLAAFEAAPPHTYDAVLMDIRMPVMDGIAAAKALRALPRPDAETIPILAMTANAYEEDVRQSRAAGMNAHLAKPIDPALLYHTLASLLEPPHA